MSIELTYLVWTLFLALGQVLLTAGVKTARFGLKWNAGARDATPEPSPLVGRLDRAQANLFETLPVFIGAVLVVHLVGAANDSTAMGVQLYFWSRLVYIPLYAFGVPYIRSLVWAAGFAGVVMLLLAPLQG